MSKVLNTKVTLPKYFNAVVDDIKITLIKAVEFGMSVETATEILQDVMCRTIRDGVKIESDNASEV